MLALLFLYIYPSSSSYHLIYIPSGLRFSSLRRDTLEYCCFSQVFLPLNFVVAVCCCHRRCLLSMCCWCWLFLLLISIHSFIRILYHTKKSVSSTALKTCLDVVLNVCSLSSYPLAIGSSTRLHTVAASHIYNCSRLVRLKSLASSRSLDGLQVLLSASHPEHWPRGQLSKQQQLLLKPSRTSGPAT